MSVHSAYLTLLLVGAAICCTACSSVKPDKPVMAAPATLEYCNISLTCLKAGESTPTTYFMGEQAPMPKLKIFAYQATGQSAQISFDGVGDGKAVHFNGQLQLISQAGNSYTFKPTGEVAGFEGDAAKKFEATPVSVIINLMPEPTI